MTIKERVRRWLGLDGPQGLSDVLAVKDSLQAGQRVDIDKLAKVLGQAVNQINNLTAGYLHHEDVLNATPSTQRVKKAIEARKKREAAKPTNGQTGPAHLTPTPDQGEGAESAEEMLPDAVADELAARRAKIACETEPDVA